jgi:hypothetical protein
MGRIEAKIIHKLNKHGCEGFPYLYSVFYEDKEQAQLNLVTDMLGSSLSSFAQKKPFTITQVLNIGI